MVEIILGLLCIVAGLLAVGFTLLVLGANAIGGATNPSAVNITPAIISAVVAALAFWGAWALLF